MADARRRVTWWMPLAVLVLCAAAIAGVWITGETQRQDNIQRTYAISGVGLLLLLIWAALLSRLRPRARVLAIAAALSLGGAAALALRIRGVTGDLVPILEWRFGRSREAPLPPSPSPTGTAVSLGVTRPVRWLEYPGFLGPRRDGTVRGVRLARDWAARPPRLIWRRKVGPAWSAFAVAGDRAFTQEQREELETVTCYDLLSGHLLWVHSDRARYESTIGGIGPRATPQVQGDEVFTMGATGILNCLDRATGERRWRRDLVLEDGATVPEWGMSGSPLVDGDLVLVAAGKRGGPSVIALRRAGGERVWSGGTDRPGYSSPGLAVLSGIPQVLVLNHGSVAGLDAATGKVLWSRKWSGSNPNVAQPVPVPGDGVVVSSGYGVGASLLRIEAVEGGSLGAREEWHTLSLKAKFANFVRRGDFLYGLDDGILACVDLSTGARRWKGGRYGHGQLILVEDLLLVSAEDGYLALVEAVPEAHIEAARVEALGEKTWNSPALAAPYLLLRNDREAACYELPLEAPPLISPPANR